MSEDTKFSKMLRRMQAAPYLQDDFVNFTFNSLRNIVLSLLPLAASQAYLKNPQGDSGVLVGATVALFALITLLLLVLNILHGWRRISELPISRLVMLPAAAIYAFAIAIIWAILQAAQP